MCLITLLLHNKLCPHVEGEVPGEAGGGGYVL